MLSQDNITSLVFSGDPRLVKLYQFLLISKQYSFDNSRIKNMIDYILIEPVDETNIDESKK